MATRARKSTQFHAVSEFLRVAFLRSEPEKVDAEDEDVEIPAESKGSLLKGSLFTSNPEVAPRRASMEVYQRARTHANLRATFNGIAKSDQPLSGFSLLFKEINGFAGNGGHRRLLFFHHGSEFQKKAVHGNCANHITQNERNDHLTVLIGDFSSKRLGGIAGNLAKPFRFWR